MAAAVWTGAARVLAPRNESSTGRGLGSPPLSSSLRPRRGEQGSNGGGQATRKIKKFRVGWWGPYSTLPTTKATQDPGILDAGWESQNAISHGLSDQIRRRAVVGGLLDRNEKTTSPRHQAGNGSWVKCCARRSTVDGQAPRPPRSRIACGTASSMSPCHPSSTD